MRTQGTLLSLLLMLAIIMPTLAQNDESEREGPEIPIGDFESSTFKDWVRYSTGSGDWYIYTDGETPPNPHQTDISHDPFSVPDPPEGRFAAVTDGNSPGTQIIYREVDIDFSYKLKLIFFYENGSGGFVTADMLSYQGPPNQQCRIDLISPSAPMDSLDDEYVLATIFVTETGDPNSMEPTEITFDLRPWEGQLVHLRLANVNNAGPLRCGVDDIRLVAIL